MWGSRTECIRGADKRAAILHPYINTTPIFNASENGDWDHAEIPKGKHADIVEDVKEIMYPLRTQRGIAVLLFSVHMASSPSEKRSCFMSAECLR